MADLKGNPPLTSNPPTAEAKPSILDGQPPVASANADPAKLVDAKPAVRRTYKALADGFLSSEAILIKEGEVFSTDAPKGDWMEEITQKEAKAANATG